VFGEDNYKFLEDQGISAKLVDKRDIVWDLDTQQFRHKLEAFRLGMQDFDEIVFLDWDELPIAPLPDDFWDVLRKKASIQAILRMYHRRKATWRKINQRMIPCASFVYIGDKKIPDDIIKIWETTSSGFSEEVAMARYIDEINSGWIGTDRYWNMHEPDFFVLNEAQIYPKEKLDTKRICFDHFNHHAVTRELKGIQNGNLKDWQKIG